MEEVHRSKLRPWIDEETINVKKFLQDWTLKGETGYSVTDAKSMRVLLSESVGVNDDTFSAVENICGAAQLECTAETGIVFKKNFDIPEGVDLHTLSLLKQDLEKRNKDISYHNSVYLDLKSRNYPHSRFIGQSECKINNNSQKREGPVSYPDVLLTVQIYRPEKEPLRSSKKVTLKTPDLIVEQEMGVLGCQFLKELRDSINCVSDIAVIGDFSDNPDISQGDKCEELFKSGFFYINGTFYSDMSDPNNIDYSEVIREWATDSRRKIGPFQMKNMEETKFIDLELQLGYPYVYIHQGNCEHLLVFSDLRLLHPLDKDDLIDYPVHQRFSTKKRIFCMVCHIHTAKWLTKNNERTPEDPYFFCDSCFEAFNYTSDMNKIGNFIAQPFFDHTIFA